MSLRRRTAIVAFRETRIEREVGQYIGNDIYHRQTQCYLIDEDDRPSNTRVLTLIDAYLH